MINLLNAGAVPFGYTSDKIESDFPGYIEDCISTGMSCHYVPDLRGTFPLPDVIISNTPPPSPLRRVRSCHAFFPEKTETLPPSPLTPPATPAVFDGEPGVQALQTGLDHIQEVRRRLRDNSSLNPLQLPQLSWPLPAHAHPQSNRRSVGEEAESAPERRAPMDESRGAGSGEEHHRWRLIGGELRMVADQFQLNKSKASGKGSSEAAAHTVAPAVLGRCLAASLLCLVWWRLYNKLR
ncbi:uncharacterized protein LOC135103822 [Scylla paramamosain]|uniref:uncharacterized protein LOC135103822 n=1 Tax=Scylla paramamosain TaxID=85552 RepID=UPI003083B4A9